MRTFCVRHFLTTVKPIVLKGYHYNRLSGFVKRITAKWCCSVTVFFFCTGPIEYKQFSNRSILSIDGSLTGVVTQRLVQLRVDMEVMI